MEKFKFGLSSILVILVIILGGAWAFTSLEKGSEHTYNQEIKDLKKENKELKEQVESLMAQLPAQENEEPNEEEVVPSENITTEPNSNYQNLIDKLQKLIDNKVVLKKGVRGTQVGTIQEFLNVYNGTSNKIDNDYGTNTINALKKFEQDQGLIITEEIGPKTFQIMIDWLKQH